MNEKEHFEKYVSILEIRNKQLKEEVSILQKEIKEYKELNFVTTSLMIVFIIITVFLTKSKMKNKHI